MIAQGQMVPTMKRLVGPYRYCRISRKRQEPSCPSDVGGVAHPPVEIGPPATAWMANAGPVKHSELDRTSPSSEQVSRPRQESQNRIVDAGMCGNSTPKRRIQGYGHDFCGSSGSAIARPWPDSRCCRLRPIGERVCTTQSAPPRSPPTAGLTQHHVGPTQRCGIRLRRPDRRQRPENEKRPADLGVCPYRRTFPACRDDRI